MLGAMIVFVVAVLIVAVYMTVIHKFLKSAEEPADFVQPAPKPTVQQVPAGAKVRLAH